MDFGSEAMVDCAGLIARRFDYWLKDVDVGIMDEPPIPALRHGDERVAVRAGGDVRRLYEGEVFFAEELMSFDL